MKRKVQKPYFAILNLQSAILQKLAIICVICVICGLIEVLLLCFGVCDIALAKEKLLIFAAIASRGPVEELAESFETEQDFEVALNFGGTGGMLAQMTLARRGDVFISASHDFMEKASASKAIISGTERRLAYLVPILCVSKGNPKNISGLSDMARPDIRVVLPDPKTVAVGACAVEIFEKSRHADAIRSRIVARVENAEKIVALLSLGVADAAIGWDYFSAYYLKQVECLPLPSESIPRLFFVSAAVSSFSGHADIATRFVEFLASEKGKNVFSKYGFSPDETALKHRYPQAIIGDAYAARGEW